MKDLLADASIRKARESAQTIVTFVERESGRIAECALALCARLEAGGKLFVLGNGGSACDAMHMAVEFMHPVVEKRRAFPAIALPQDTALASAIGNDSDFARGYAEQLRVLGAPADVVVALSTSGDSANAVRAVRAAQERDMLTIAMTGRSGGRLAELATWSFVVPSFSTHRIQEAHALLLHVLWDLVHVARGEEDVL